jgi:hypothetical protein
MAILQISQIQVRRGLQQDLPQLASGELGWSIDSRRLYIGNGTIAEGAPQEGVTEVLTQYSAVNFTYGITQNVSTLTGNVSSLTSNLNQVNTTLAAIQAGQFTSNVITLPGSSSGTIDRFPTTNGAIYYAIQQSNKERSGRIEFSRFGSAVAYDDEYSETAATDVVLTITANSSMAFLNYTAGTLSSFSYQIRTV